MGRQNCHPRRRIGITGEEGTPWGVCQDHLNPELGGQRWELEALSQPVDPVGSADLGGPLYPHAHHSNPVKEHANIFCNGALLARQR